MERKTKERSVLQWHPAFYAGIQIELSEEAEKLTFENEHQLGTKPKEIDVLIIKKSSEERIQKNIGQIFQTHNIVEYKSPDDYLSIDDFYKVYGYACFYKSDVSGADTIKAEEITISFVCRKCPRKLITHLKKVRHMRVDRHADGIYYISGDIFRMQFIITSELSEENNLWLKSLTNDLKERKSAEKLIYEYEKHKKNGLYKSVMNIIVQANIGKFEEVKSMCEALEELMKDELDAREKQGEMRGEIRGEKRGQMKGIQSLIEACKSLGASWEAVLDMVIDKFSTPKDEAEEYMHRYW